MTGIQRAGFTVGRDLGPFGTIFRVVSGRSRCGSAAPSSAWPSEAGTGRAAPVSYAIDIDPGAQDAIAALPVEVLPAGVSWPANGCRPRSGPVG